MKFLMGDIAIALACHPVLRISVYASRCSWPKIPVQTLMLLVAENENDAKKRKITQIVANGYSSESTP